MSNIKDVEEGEEETLNSNTGKIAWVVIIIIAGIIWFLFGGKWGTTSFDTAHFDAGMLILGFGLLESGWMYLKHKSPKVLIDSNPSHFTLYINDFKQVGRWGVVRLGGIMASGMHYSGKEATLVAPYEYFRPVGNCLVCSAKVTIIKPERLPHGIRKYITDYQLPLPVFFGVFSSVQLEDPANAKIQEELEQADQTIAVHEKTGKRILEMTEDMMEVTKRMTGKDTVTEALKKAFKEQKEEE